MILIQQHNCNTVLLFIIKLVTLFTVSRGRA